MIFSFFQSTNGLLIVSLVLLALSSAVSWVLRFRINFAPHQVLDNLNARINAWWMMLAVLVIAIYLGSGAVITLFAFISFFALREFISILPTRRGDYFPLLISFYVVIPYQYYLVYTDWYGLFSIFIPMYLFILIPIASLKAEDTTHFLERSAKIHWGLMIAVYCISYVPALLNLKLINFGNPNVWLVIWLVLVVQTSDVLQYVCGKLLGRNKLSPQLSPSKTVEGLVGGVLLAVIVGVLMSWLTPFSYFEAAYISFVMCIFGFFGGLVLSAIKRDRGVKDWGKMIQGHGGMLDRIDSICFSAPILFHILRYWWT